MADHSLPALSSTYTNFVTELHNRINDSDKWNTTNTTYITPAPTNQVLGTIRWNNTTFKWEIQTATNTWATHSARYDININGTVGATTAADGKFTTLSTTGIASLGNNSTMGAVPIVTTTSTSTLTNKTLTTPVISSISNSGTITLPTGADTLVGRATTDTLTNKTITAPKMTSATSILDASSNELISFPATVGSAVNNIQVKNAISGQPAEIAAVGTDTNVSLKFTPKGTGTVSIGADAIVTLTATQTLTNKTLTTPTISSISNGGTVTVPSGTDTLVNLASTQTLTNKNLAGAGNTFPTFNQSTTGTANFAIDLTGGANGSIPYQTGSGATSMLAAGTAGYLLQTNGAAAPTWIASSGLTVDTASKANTIKINTSAANASFALAFLSGSTDNTYISTYVDVDLTYNPSTNTLNATEFSGNANTVTGGVYTSGNQTIAGIKTFSSTIVGSVNGNANYATTAGGAPATDVYAWAKTAVKPSYTKSEVGLSLVDNTADASKPVSTAQQTALNLKADLASPTFTGTVSGISKAMVGLSSVDNTADSVKIVSSATTTTMSSARTDAAAYPVVWGTTGSTSQLYSCTAVNIQSSTGTLNCTTLYATGNVTAYSDARLKKDLEVIPNALDKVTKLTGYTYTRIDSGDRQSGLIAQDIQRVLPEVISEKDGYLGVSYGNMVGLLVEAIKELKSEIDTLKAKYESN